MSEYRAKAIAAFEEAVNHGFDARLVFEQMTPDDPSTGEVSLELPTARNGGLLHEDILQAIEIASRHGGRLWLDRGRDEPLAILFPVPKEPPGPKGQDSPAKKERAEKHNGPS